MASHFGTVMYPWDLTVLRSVSIAPCRRSVFRREVRKMRGMATDEKTALSGFRLSEKRATSQYQRNVILQLCCCSIGMIIFDRFFELASIWPGCLAGFRIHVGTVTAFLLTSLAGSVGSAGNASLSAYVALFARVV